MVRVDEEARLVGRLEGEVEPPLVRADQVLGRLDQPEAGADPAGDGVVLPDGERLTEFGDGRRLGR